MASASEKESQKAARKAKLKAEMERRGIVSSETYMRVSYDSYDSEEVTGVVQSYINREYPTLNEVVSLLTPFARKDMLVKERLWFDNDLRCQLYVEGDSDWPDLSSIRSAMERDRSDRQSMLEAELVSEGVCKDVLTDGLPSECKSMVGDFIEQNHGNVVTVAAAIRIQYRLKHLKDAFHDCNTSFPVGLRLYPHDYKSKTKLIGSFKNRLKKYEEIDERMQSFLLETKIDVTEAKELATEVQTERESRQKMVDDKAMELGFDLKKLCLLHGHQIEEFVRLNKGKYEERMNHIALEHKFQELRHTMPSPWKRPSLDDIIKNVPNMGERLNLAFLKGKEGIDCLCRQLVEEHERRFMELSKICLVEINSSMEGLVGLPKKVETQIHRSKYVLFGIGDPPHEVEQCMETFRAIELMEALKKSPLECSRRFDTENVRHDERFRDFICGKCGAKTARDITVDLFDLEIMRRNEIAKALSEYNITIEGETIERNVKKTVDDYIKYGHGTIAKVLEDAVKSKCEFESRRNEIAEALSKYNITLEDKVVKDTFPVSQFIRHGRGTCTKIAEQAVKRKRMLELKRAFSGTILNMSFTELSLCQDFLAGRGRTMTAGAVASLSIDQRSTRKAQLERLIDMHGFTINPLDRIQDYNLRKKVRGYVDKGTGNIQWIAAALSFQLHCENLKAVFGKLRGMLSCASFGNLCEWTDKRRGELAPLANEIHGKLFPFPQTIGSDFTPALDHTEDSEQYLAQLIMDFAGPSCSEFVKYELPRKCDSRLALLLAKSPSCPWNSAEEAVRVLRQERKARKEQIDQLIPPCDLSSDSTEEGIFAMFSMQQAGEENDDMIWEKSDTRAQYINGFISMDEATNELLTETRRKMLRHALWEGSLNTMLAKEDERCILFVREEAGIKEADAKLSALATALHAERMDRLQLLAKSFDDAGVGDTGIGVKVEHSYLALHRLDNKSSFPGEERAVTALRMKFVDFGKGRAEDVVEAVILFQRRKRLETALKQQFNEWLPSQVKKWMLANEECSKFILKSKCGYAGQEELKSVISVITSGDHLKPLSDDDSSDSYHYDDDSCCYDEDDCEWYERYHTDYSNY